MKDSFSRLKKAYYVASPTNNLEARKEGVTLKGPLVSALLPSSHSESAEARAMQSRGTFHWLHCALWSWSHTRLACSWTRWGQAGTTSFQEGLCFHVSCFDIAFLYPYRAPNLLPSYFCSSSQEKNHPSGFCPVSFSQREHKLVLPGRLLKHRVDGRPPFTPR